MTIFTKTETDTDKKNAEGVKEDNPKQVVVCEADEEKHISNCGWVPMEGGNFDRRREAPHSAHSLLFDFLHHHWHVLHPHHHRTTRTLSMLAGIFGRARCLISKKKQKHQNAPLHQAYFHTHRHLQFCHFGFFLPLPTRTHQVSVVLILDYCSSYYFNPTFLSVAYQKGVYHGWNAATFSNRGTTERLVQNVEINANDSYEKIDVPKFGSNRPAIFLHDFKQNLTAIVDTVGNRCFVKDLDRTKIRSPRMLIEMLRNIDVRSENSRKKQEIPKFQIMAPEVAYAQTRMVRETYNVGDELTKADISTFNSTILSRHCAFRQTYKLRKQEAQTRSRRAAGMGPALSFASMAGDSVQLEEISF
ncbi:Protein CBG14684 [Caenorhabditis briggsae]|uniref:Integral membrane protein 2 n=1 Tax=Caenorhabditis briggsae TaxID=6238 RepID=A8XKG2_CAEBR|nr:Protein CBG14684 [Caenorhabditis briggsae]CAP33136.2 Protein CBG14684 [Caenorhabditis briggsae]